MIETKNIHLTNLEGNTYEVQIEKGCKGFYDVTIGNTYIGFIEKIRSKWWLKLSCPFVSESRLADFNESNDSLFTTFSNALNYIYERFADNYCDYGNKLN